MSKYIYNLLCYDAAEDDTCALVAFTKEEDAHEWRRDYVHLNYGTDFDMEQAGVWVWVEPTIVEK